MIQDAADRFLRKPLIRHLAFFIASLIAIDLIGYFYGTFDQSIHIPFLKKAIDPTLYPGDPFLDFRFVHYSYFWFFFEPFDRLGLLEPVMFITQIIATYLVFWMIYSLSLTLFHNSLAALFSVIAFIPPHIAMPGFPVIEFSLLNRTFVLPFLLVAINLYLKQKPLLAYFLLGLVYNLHVLSVSYVLVMFLLDSVIRWKSTGFKRLLFSVSLFIIGAAPVLLWRVGSSPIDLSLRPDLLAFSARTLQYTIYDIFSTYPPIVITTLSGAASLALWWIGYRKKPITKCDEVIRNFILAIGVILTVQLISTYWLPITILIQMQISRAAVFLLIFGYLYFIQHLSTQYQSKQMNAGQFGILAAIASTYPHPLLPLILFTGKRWLLSKRVLQAATITLFILAFGLTITYAVQNSLWKPGIHIYGQKTPWTEVQIWAKEHTRKDSVFITPPLLFDNYASGWRVFSERSTVVSLADSIEIPFDPDYLPEWLSRFIAVAPGAVNQFNGNVAENGKIAMQAYDHLTDQQVVQIAIRYHANYLVVQHPGQRDFPVAYQNQGFTVYDLSQAVSIPTTRIAAP